MLAYLSGHLQVDLGLLLYSVGQKGQPFARGSKTEGKEVS